MQHIPNTQLLHGDVNSGLHPVAPGAIRNSRSVKDFKLSRSQAPVNRPASYMPQEFFNMPSVSQGRQPDCGGAAGRNLLQLTRFYNKLTAGYDNLSMRFLYDYEKSVDGYAGSDGTTIKAIGQALTTVGSCNEPLCINDVNLSFADFANWKTVTAIAQADALPRKLSSYLFLDDKSIEGIKQAIFQNQAVILEVKLGSEWWTAANGQASYAEKDILPVRPPHPIVSGHFVVAGAYDENYIYFINSFGPAWGRNGFGYFGADYAPYIVDGLAVSTSTPEVLLPEQYNWYEQIVINIQNSLSAIIASLKGRKTT